MGVPAVITFYSYKGGVGRSFLLANVGTLLALWGYRVLCIDWDLEAPGLDRYFRPFLGTVERGLAEFVEDSAAGKSPDWRKSVTPVDLPQASGRLALMAAGSGGDDYIPRVQAFDWQELYAVKQVGNRLEEAREEWLAEYDFVLLDSRTGITDIGGICTAHLPDILAVVFAANRQNVEGVAEAVRRAQRQRDAMPIDRGRLLVLPVPSRFETQVEYERGKAWLDIFAERFGPLYAGWAHKDSKPADLLNQLKIPYVPYWSFGEELAVLKERRPAAADVSHAIHSVAALLARRLEGSSDFLGNRDAYVSGARAPGAQAETHDVFISYARRDGVEFPSKLADGLASMGLTVWRDPYALSGEPFATAINKAIRSCRHFVALLGPHVSEHQGQESLTAGQRLQEQSIKGDGETSRLVMVRMPGARPQRLEHLPGARVVALADLDPQRAAQAIAEALGHAVAVQPDADEGYW